MTIFVVETDSGLYNCLSLAGHELGEARIWDTSDVGAFQCRSPPKSPGLEPPQAIPFDINRYDDSRRAPMLARARCRGGGGSSNGGGDGDR